VDIDPQATRTVRHPWRHTTKYPHSASRELFHRNSFPGPLRITQHFREGW
jgi:hypothetical protein